jgi:hypothetical protein
MDPAPSPQLMISKAGIAVGLALLAFGAYTTISYFARGGQATTLLRAVAAVPLGVVAIYLSFQWGCSVCGVAFKRVEVSTSTTGAGALAEAIARRDGIAAARALTAARGQGGNARITADYCPQGRDLARVRVSGAGAGGAGTRVMSGATARPLIDALDPPAGGAP